MALIDLLIALERASFCVGAFTVIIGFFTFALAVDAIVKRVMK